MSNDTVKVLALAGSTRSGSLNKQLLAAVVSLADPSQAEIEVIDLVDYPLPLYDGDLEEAEGVPENAMRLKEKFLAADALLISTPEYNTSLPAVLKNAIDWISRPVDGVPWLSEIRGQVLGAVSASPGATGGMQALAHLRQMFMNLGAYVVPGFTACPNAAEAFDEAGRFVNDGQEKQYAAYVAQVVALARAQK